MDQVALLRAVNVGGRSGLRMADLRAVAEGLGFADVRTLLQSGNLVFAAKGKTAAALESALKAALKQHLGIETDFLVRSAKELEAVIAANPFPDEASTAPAPGTCRPCGTRTRAPRSSATRAGRSISSIRMESAARSSPDR
jgi:uncharacterized protein (DUF1697 family)